MVGYLKSTTGTNIIQAKQWILRTILNLTMLVFVETEFTGVFAMSELGPKESICFFRVGFQTPRIFFSKKSQLTSNLQYLQKYIQ